MIGPFISKEDKSVLWNNLPYCGMYTESPFQGKYTDLPTPNIMQINVQGRPLPLVNDGVNKNLRLIGFEEQIIEAPVTTLQEWRLVTYSSLLEYRVKWSLTRRAKVGFYTTNYLADVNSETSKRRMLLIGEDGPCLFEGTKGTFFFTGAIEFCLIVDANVEVRLNIKCRSPCCIFFPKLELYVPIPYRLENGCVFATETKTSDVNKDVVFAPIKKYVNLTASIKKYLIDTSVLIDFTPTLVRIKEGTPDKTLENLSLIEYSFTDGNLYFVKFPENTGEGYRVSTSVVKDERLELCFPTTIGEGEKYIKVTVTLSIALSIVQPGNDSSVLISLFPGKFLDRILDYENVYKEDKVLSTGLNDFEMYVVFSKRIC